MITIEMFDELVASHEVIEFGLFDIEANLLEMLTVEKVKEIAKSKTLFYMENGFMWIPMEGYFYSIRPVFADEERCN